MSRVGKKPIPLPDKVYVTITEESILVKGPKGELTQAIPKGVGVVQEEKCLRVVKKEENKKTKALYGLVRSLVNNMVEGVTHGFKKELEIVGVGYRATLQGKDLVLNVGHSHPIHIPSPSGITFEVEKSKVRVLGINKQLVGDIAATIRSKRKPEPYKGKGIKYVDEVIRRKAGNGINGFV